MTDVVPSSDRQRTDDLARQVARNTQRIEDLTRRADAADLRADTSEAQAELDREILASLRLDGQLLREQAEQLERGLQTSRTIGAAIGVVMATHQIDQDRALQYLKRKSNQSNVKLSVLCAGIVANNQT